MRMKPPRTGAASSAPTRSARADPVHGQDDSVHVDIDHGGGWPTREQGLLLQAALLRDSEAVEAWHKWRSCVDFERMDLSSTRLLPLVYKNLHDHLPAEPLMSKLRGAYRLAWTKNQVLFHSMAPVLQALHDAGLQTLTLKGAALIVQYYREYGLRPTSDFDVLVRTEQAPVAIQLLTKMGWRPKRRTLATLKGSAFSISHGDSFVDTAGRILDLHWHVLHDCTYTGADDDFWEGAVPIEVSGVPTLALNPADQVLHVCVHGARWSRIAPIRWAADAATVINSCQEELDWPRLIAQARERLLVLPMRETLTYLQEALSVPVPVDVLHELGNMPVSALERIERGSRLNPYGKLGRLPVLLLRYRRHRKCPRTEANTQVSGQPMGFLAFVQHTWRLDRQWKVPFCALAKSLRRLRAMAVAPGRWLARKLGFLG